MKTKSKSFNIKRVTLIVPCFNEEEVLPEFYRRTTEVLDQLSQKNIQTDIIFVDDCSRDNTWAILDKLTCSDPRVRAIRFARNRGHQIAVTAGLDIADGDVVIILDADLQDPPELIEPCIMAGSRVGDIVLDPFMGSGTTAAVAQRLNRLYLGCELNEDYKVLQKERLKQPSLELL